MGQHTKSTSWPQLAAVLSKAAGILINFSLKSMEMFSLILIELFQVKASSCPCSFTDVYPDISLT